MESEKYKHSMRADPLVSVYEGMILNQTKAESCCLLLQRWIYILSAKGLKGSV